MIAASPYARGTPALGRTGIARLSSVSTRPLCYGSMVGRCRAARLPRRDGIYSPAGGSCRLSRPGATARIRTAIGAVPMRCTALVLRRRGGRRRHRTFIAGAIRRVSNPLPEPTGAPSMMAESGDPASQALRLQPGSGRRRHACPLHSPGLADGGGVDPRTLPCQRHSKPPREPSRRHPWRIARVLPPKPRKVPSRFQREPARSSGWPIRKSTPAAIRTPTLLLLRETPLPSWATGAWYARSDLN